MTSQLPETLSPVLYLPHGGGPLPLLGDKGHEDLVDFLKVISSELGEPSAILVISAHWEEEQPTITGGAHPELIYDYYGFPPESYEFQYLAPGEPQLANDVFELIENSGVKARLDDRRGFDHGLFVPLELMYPEAHIPCIQLSLLKNLNPGEHIALGKSLAALRRKNVLIVGSGLSFHNMKAFFSKGSETMTGDEEFDRWLTNVCTNPEISSDEREKQLVNWENAPSARYCHPREEHLLPLHVCYGAACAETPTAKVVFNRKVMGQQVSALLWR
ncbi:MAG: dioxygenase [Gammaproteobacteria bacterium]|nr:dioxygenase [Gammaproteobacteria bacterium]